MFAFEVLGWALSRGQHATGLPVPLPPAVATAVPMVGTPTPPSDACSCKSRPCGSEWTRGAPGACADTIPAGHYLLRLSFVGITSPSTDASTATSLWDVEEDAEVCFRVTGAPDKEEVCVRKPADRDACSMRRRLRVSLARVTGAGPGLDIVVRRGEIDLAKRHIDALDAPLRQRTLCSGFVAAKEGWSRDPRWRWAPAKIGFFLDPI